MSTQVRTTGDEEMLKRWAKSERNNKFSNAEHKPVPITGKKCRIKKKENHLPILSQ
jgi:hypothetical protein